MNFSLSHLLQNVLEDWSFVALKVIWLTLRNHLVLFQYLANGEHCSIDLKGPLILLNISE